MFVIISVFYYRGSRDGIQPERLNAEGEARVLLAEGFASLHPRLRATRSARAFDLSGRAAGGFTTDFHGIRHGFSQIFFVGVECLRG